MMPGTSGIDLIGLIHQVDAEIVCVIITGYATVELAVRAIKVGAYDFLTKPFTTDDLLLVVNQGLERRRLSLEARRLQDIEREAQRLEAEKKRLEELDRAKAAFMLLVSHELKAPVSAILTYLDLLLNDYVPAEEVKETLERVQARAREELDMISDLLEFGKVKEIKPLATPEPLQMETALQRALQELEVMAAAKELKITVEVERGLKPVRIAADRAKSVWTNLISNAIKYTPQGGAVQIRLRQQGEMLGGEVQDNGIGIPQAAQEKLFSEFYRAQNARELSIPGTGLGLAIVRQIIESAGGKIWVESQEGQGARFTFTLPVVASS
jgi:two-component system sensor histidine kinase/response regulator